MGNVRHLLSHNTLKEAINRVKLDRKQWVVVKINALTKLCSVAVETNMAYCYRHDNVDAMEENSVAKANNFLLNFNGILYSFLYK